MKNKFYYIGLNFFMPGMGQMAAGRYVRGLLQATGSLIAVFRLAAAVFIPLTEFYKGNMLSEEIPEISLSAILTPVLIFLIILAWSIIDMMFGPKEKTEKFRGENHK
ncbi:MAG: hypothetical protein PHV82_01775 [Victivallaceae bacterium]|nr:hypothetical protein [Victivallaceae bacterium]